MKLSIVIPAYNEERTILMLLAKVKAVALPGDLKKEIIVVDDGSTDKTASILDGLSPDPSVTIIHQPNAGKAGALVRGIKESTGDIILIQDADLEYDPEQYPQLLSPILDGRSKVVYGSRFIGNIDGMRWVNRFANDVSNWTFSCLWGVRLTDINTCYKIFTRDAFNGITIISRNFAFETELTVKFLKKGLSIKEVPIQYVARSREEGKKIRWSTALEMYWPILKYRFFGNSA